MLTEKLQESRKKLNLLKYRDEFCSNDIVSLFIADPNRMIGEVIFIKLLLSILLTNRHSKINPEFRAIFSTEQLFDIGELRYGRVIGVNKTKKGRIVVVDLVKYNEFPDKMNLDQKVEHRINELIE